MAPPSASSRSGRSYRGETAAQRLHERRERLLQAALQVVGTQGFKAATVRAICAESGLTQRYYYEAFANAEDMMIALYEQQLQRLAEVQQQAIAQSPANAYAAAQAALEAVFGHLQADPAAARVLFLEIFGISPRVDQAYRAGTQRMIDLLIGYMRPLLDADHLRGRDLDLQGSAIVGAVIFIAMKWILSDYAQPQERIVRNLLLLVRAMLAEMGATPGQA